ncbi:tRNA uridine-5-carboxymethylaminomethyl(34) synthesis GTPase MnmE [Segetibacter sp.]|jgi:tRNA modification GTPase|uniref:tRNA uridine-5-carboxymethylaminomethyl(34) synthesis GTPase MnmE n=1 Tax=Segetibacter sp. TaxID=2231182 RepID=UPI0026191933|nr:tRNA uridine-5-carboxymethylaminomethyl(34) synthesis GTPase MnmE [Segetibacter sp.]MCW3082588.1 mnmE [Segetibacter sp.]
MLGKLADWNDTIVALATPQGIGAIGVVRVSGKLAIEMVDSLFPSKDLCARKSHTLHVGLLESGGVPIDQVVVSLFKGPSSYTGENVVEISSHGSPYILEKIITAITKAGARLAKPGEFTQRAFLNGKLDLTQAEAVADLIYSNTEISRKHALQNIRGGFSSVLKTLRDELLSFSALIELELDFSQEDVEFADRSQLNGIINNAEKVTAELLSSFALGNVIKNGVQVAIIGKPNAGKSTLLNTLLNENRAIVSEIAGTTRDTIEEVLNIDGILFRLIDTAGIRQHTNDIIESIGVERSLEKMSQADVVIYLFDVNEISTEELLVVVHEMNEKGIHYLLVGNKIDLSTDKELAEKFSNINVLYISAGNKKNVDVVKQRLVDEVLGGKLQNESSVVSNARHYEALRLVHQSLIDIQKGMEINISGDLLSLDIRRCLHYLGEITGEITNEDQLDYIFSKFCIGK